MNSNEIEALADLLRDQSRYIPHRDVPAVLLGSPYLTDGRLPEHHTCPECGSQAMRVSSDDPNHDYVIACKEVRAHKTESREEEILRYDLQVDAILEDIAGIANFTPGDSSLDERPAFFAKKTEEEILLCVLGPADNYENAVHDAIQYIVDVQRPALLFTPREQVEELHELIEPYAVVGIIQPLSLLALDDRAYVREIARTVQREVQRKQRLFQKHGISQDDLRWVLEDHPSLIKSKLSTLQTLREYSQQERDGIGRTIWTEFEKVCKAAFGYLDFEAKLGAGGVDDSGKEVADAIIGFPPTTTVPTVDELSRLHGIVDAKSGGQAGFESEAVSKQLDYFEEIRDDKLFDPYTFLHLFVVFDVDADELVDWYEVARPHYPAETGMVVITANALRQMVDVMQSPTGKAEINRSERDTRDVFRYFFDPQLYSRYEFAEIADMPQLNKWGASSVDTQSKYAEYDNLLFVTQEMVNEWVQRSMTKEQGTDSLFEINSSE